MISIQDGSDKQAGNLSYDDNEMFISFTIIVFYTIVELIPILVVIDDRFIDVCT